MKFHHSKQLEKVQERGFVFTKMEANLAKRLDLDWILDTLAMAGMTKFLIFKYTVKLFPALWVGFLFMGGVFRQFDLLYRCA